MKQARYNLFTAIALIVGIVVGSGIFFKSDNILIATNGNVLLGILIFILAAISIIFGCLSIAELAARTNQPGGILSYAKEFITPSMGSGFGWFQTFIYMPTITAVLTWVSGIYFCIFFNIEQSLETQMLMGGFCFLVLFITNIFAAGFGGKLQNLSMVIKLIPLVIIGFAGVIWGNSSAPFNSQALSQIASTGWLGAIGPIAFSFDGWIISTSVAYDIKNSKRNLPLALVISPIIILVLYILYFVGISNLVGTDQIIAMGDDHLNFAANLIFGQNGTKIIMLFVLISVLGTLNGLIIGMIRMPYALGLEKMIPGSKKLGQISEKNSFPLHSAFFSFVIVVFWLVIHYFVQAYGLFPNSDISEISIVTSYLLYILLYYQVFKLWRKKEIKSFFRGFICPLLATIGSLIIFSGGLQNSLFGFYLVICLFVFGSGFLYHHWAQKKKVS